MYGPSVMKPVSPDERVGQIKTNPKLLGKSKQQSKEMFLTKEQYRQGLERATADGHDGGAFTKGLVDEGYIIEGFGEHMQEYARSTYEGRKKQALDERKNAIGDYLRSIRGESGYLGTMDEMRALVAEEHDIGGDKLDEQLDMIVKVRDRQKNNPGMNYGIGAAKGAPANTSDGDERNDNLIPRANPIFDRKENKKGDHSWNAGKMIVNTIPSAWNVIADIGNMALNPIDTAKGLGNMFLGASKNAGEKAIGAITGDSKEEIDKKFKEISTQDNAIGWMVRKLNESEGVADAVADAMVQRYGNRENIERTLTEDPIGAISDMLAVIEGGATLVKTGARSSKLASLSKVADKADDVARLANAADPYNMGMRGVAEAGKGVARGAVNTVKGAQKAIGNGLDWISEEVRGLDKNTVKQAQSNPYVNEYWNKLESEIIENGISTKPTEMVQPMLEEVSTKLTDAIEKRRASLSDSGPLYDDIRKLNIDIDTSSIGPELTEVLDKYNIKVGDDGKLNFTKSQFSQPSDMGSTQAIYDRIMANETMDVETILNLRKAIDNALNWEGAPTKNRQLLLDMRKVVDDKAKNQVPQLRELDELYAQEIRYLNEIEEGLVYRQGDRKGKFRDNIQQIMNTINNPNRAEMKKRLVTLVPDLPERVEAISMMPTIAKAYVGSPNLMKQVQSASVVGIPTFIGSQVGGIEGAVLGGIFGYITDSAVKKIRKSQITKAISDLSPEAQKRLLEINEAMEANQALRQSEIELLNSIKTKLQEEANKVDDAASVVSDGGTIADDVVDVADSNTTPKSNLGVGDDINTNTKGDAIDPQHLTKLDLDEADTVFLERSKTLRDIASKYNDYDSFLNDVLKVRGMSNYYVAQKYGKEYLPLLNATTDYGKISNIEQIKKIWDTAKSDSFSKAGSATSAIMEDDIISKRAEYEVAKNELDSFIDKIADEFDSKGIKTSLKFLDKEGNIRQGGVDRIMQKAKDKGGIENVTDISRGSVLVKTRSSVNKLVKYLERNGYIVDNKFAQPTKLGYSDASILFESSNGIQSELQIHIPEILVAKEGENVVKYGFMSQDQYTRIVERAGVEGGLGHKYYEEWRELDTLEDTPDTIVKKKEIESKSKEYYDKFILSLK